MGPFASNTPAILRSQFFFLLLETAFDARLSNNYFFSLLSFSTVVFV